MVKIKRSANISQVYVLVFCLYNLLVQTVLSLILVKLQVGKFKISTFSVILNIFCVYQFNKQLLLCYHGQLFFGNLAIILRLI